MRSVSSLQLPRIAAAVLAARRRLSSQPVPPLRPSITRPLPSSAAVAVAAVAPPSPHEVDQVVRRAAQQGNWRRALRLFEGSLRLRCVPLTATYATVLGAALRDGGWRAAAALADDLATSPLSAATLYQAVADLLLAAGDSTSNSRDDLVPLMQAAAARGVLFPPRHRCAVWAALLDRGEAAQAAALAGTLTGLTGPVSSHWADVRCGEDALLLRAAADCGDWRLALSLASADHPSHPQHHSEAASDDCLVWLLTAFAAAAETGTGAVPWALALSVVQQRLPLVQSPAAVAAVEAALERLRRAMAAIVTRPGGGGASAAMQYREVGLLSPVGPGTLDAVRGCVTDPRAALRAGAAAGRRAATDEALVESVRSSALVLCAFPEPLMAAAGAGAAWAEAFPDPWLRRRLPSAGTFACEAVGAAVAAVVAATAEGSLGGDAVLQLTAGLLAYADWCAASCLEGEGEGRAALWRLRGAAVSLVADGGHPLEVPCDSASTKALLSAVLPAASEEEGPEGSALLDRCLAALQPSVATLLLRPETALDIVCAAAATRDSAPLWAAALRYYKRLQRLGWATAETRAMVEGALRQAGGSSGGGASLSSSSLPAALAATDAYATQQHQWDGSLGPLRDLALPLLAEAGRWTRVAELLTVLEKASVALAPQERAYRRRCRQSCCEERVAAAQGEASVMWAAWREASDGSAKDGGDDNAQPMRLSPVALEVASTALLSGGLWAEADALLTHHCPLCSTITSIRDPPTTVATEALWLYHGVRRGHVALGDGAEAAMAVALDRLCIARRPAARREAQLQWRCAAAAACRGGDGEGELAGYEVLAAALAESSREEARQHYRSPPVEAAEAEAQVQPQAEVRQQVAVAPWVLRALPGLLAAAARAVTADDTAAQAQLESVAVALAPLAAEASGGGVLDGWVSLVQLLASNGTATPPPLAARIARRLLKAAATSQPLALLQVAVRGAVTAEWRVVAAALPDCATGEADGGGGGAVYETVVAQALSALLESSSGAGSALALLDACGPRLRHETARGPALAVVLAAREARTTAGADRPWAEGYAVLAAAGGGAAADPRLACRVLAATAAEGPWRLAALGWRRAVLAAPHVDWAAEGPAAADALLGLTLAMERQGAGPEVALRWAVFQAGQLGVPLSSAALASITRAAAAEGAAPTGVELRRCLGLARGLARMHGEQRVAALVHAALAATTNYGWGCCESLSLWGRAIAPPAAPSDAAAAGPTDEAAGAGSGGALPRLTDDQLDRVAAVAPVLVLASPRQLEELAATALAGTARPLELPAVLRANAAAVRGRLAREGQQPSAAVEFLAGNRKLVATLAECHRQWRQEGDGERSGGEEAADFPAFFASAVFDGFIGPATAVEIWRRCRGAALALAASRWPPAAEAELRAAVMARLGRVPPRLATAPALPRAAIGHYWSVFHHVLLPGLQFSPQQRCCLAAYAAQADAAATRRDGATGTVSRDWHAPALAELAARIHAAHFIEKGDDTATPTTDISPQSIVVMYALSMKALTRLWTQLQQDARSRRLYAPVVATDDATVVPPTGTDTAAAERQAVVAALGSLERRVAAEEAGGAVAVERHHHYSNYSHRSCGEEEPRGVLLRALVRCMGAHAAARLTVPPAASLALVEELKALSCPRALGLPRAEAALVRAAAAEEQLRVWRALLRAEGGALSPLPFMEPAHVAAIGKMVCATRESVRRLPQKKALR